MFSEFPHSKQLQALTIFYETNIRAVKATIKESLRQQLKGH